MGDDGVHIHLIAYKVTNDFIVTAAMHARWNVAGVDSYGTEVLPPSPLVDRHGIHDNAVEIEDQSQARRYLKLRRRNVVALPIKETGFWHSRRIITLPES